MLRSDLGKGSDAHASMLTSDRAAAAWWTYKPPPQVVAQSNPGELPHGAEGAGRWVRPPAVRKVDSELQSFGQSSPRLARSGMESMTSSSPHSFHRTKTSTLPPDLAGPVSQSDTFGTSLALPSMGNSSAIGYATEVPSHASDGDPSPLGMSPHRRGRGNFNQIAPDFSGRYVAPAPPGGIGANFENWMAAQHAPTPRMVAPKISFTERLHAEGQNAAPTPFTQGANPSPRHAHAGGVTDASPPAARRQHHNDLWLQQERLSHPRAGAATDSSSKTSIGQGAAAPPGAGAGALWGGEQVNLGHASERDQITRNSTDLTRGYQTFGGVKTWVSPATSARDVLTDPAAGGQLLPPPAPANESPGGHRRGRSDLHYMNSPRLERAEYAAREKEAQRLLETFGNRRSTTVATVPSIDDQRRHQQYVNSGNFEQDRMPRTSADFHPGASDREWRLQQRRNNDVPAGVPVNVPV